MKKSTIAVTILAILLLMLGVVFNKEFTPAEGIPSVSKDEPFSTLVCNSSDAQAELENVLNTYQNEGALAAYQIANDLVSSGKCEFSTGSPKWWSTGLAPKEKKEYEEVACTALTNGHCISVQPVYMTTDDNDEVVWSGYMLIEPKVPTGQQPPLDTVVSRLQKGLVLDLNF